jgi:hypothetical protein
LVPVAVAAATLSAAQIPRRGVYTTWGTVVLEEGVAKGKSWIERITSHGSYRSFDVNHLPVAAVPKGVTLSPSEEYLYSAILDDTKRLLATDWTLDFDSFWSDRVESHETLFNVLYGKEGGIRRMIFGDASGNAAGEIEVRKALNKLKSVLKWAQETERCYSAIANARFRMQREVFEAFEREKILAGCVEAVQEFEDRVPFEYKRKAKQELGLYLGNMRHWVYDCPNAKRAFPRVLA